MRLLTCSKDGRLGLTEEFLEHDPLPPYAILSHTWEDGNEVTYQDMIDGTDRNQTKSGWNKIIKCGEQAHHDGLKHFWVDTCCIDKTKHIELSRSINPCFGGIEMQLDVMSTYQTYLLCRIMQRVSTHNRNQLFERAGGSHEDWTCLGDKKLLELQISEVTGVPYSALQGTPLSLFNANERLLWMEPRQTKIAEDKAYALIGIFDVQMPLIYGEGAKGAFDRLQKEVEKINKCVHDLHSTNPRYDKRRIEDANGGLLEKSYRWIVENSEFQQWKDADRDNQLLWVKGDPGKGKTMLLCGVIDEISNSMPKQALLSYFFCQATDSRLNNAAAVLKGLIYLFLTHQPSLVKHIQKKYDHAGKSLFEDVNAWVALSEALSDILMDPNLIKVYVVIDALDECVEDLPKLLDFIVQKSSGLPSSQNTLQVKWIVSSRNWPEIEERLGMLNQNTRLSLEINAASVSNAVRIFIQNRVDQLAEKKRYDPKRRGVVFQHMSQNANDTFLWVALACRDLENTPKWKTLARLSAFPSGLDPLYEQMMRKMRNSDDFELCRQILEIASIVYRPISTKELTGFVEMLEDIAVNDVESLHEIIKLCGSFLTVRQGTVYFVHQSAKDYLLAKAFDEIFPSGVEASHHMAFSRSLKTMSALHRDMHNLGALAYSIELVQRPVPDPVGCVKIRVPLLGITPSGL